METQLHATVKMQAERDLLLIACKKALDYIETHCHELIETKRQSTYVPALLKTAIRNTNVKV